MGFNDVTTVSLKDNDFKIHFWCKSKDEAKKLFKNADFTEKSGTLLKHKNLFSHQHAIITFDETEIGKKKSSL